MRQCRTEQGPGKKRLRLLGAGWEEGPDSWRHDGVASFGRTLGIGAEAQGGDAPPVVRGARRGRGYCSAP